jgi:hypothetical protein
VKQRPNAGRDGRPPKRTQLRGLRRAGRKAAGAARTPPEMGDNPDPAPIPGGARSAREPRTA